MKLTKEQLKNLIKEEATKIRKEMELEKNKSSKRAELENRKTEIMLEMTNMYGEGEVDEIFGFGENPQQLHDRFQQQVQKNGLIMKNLNGISKQNNYPIANAVEDYVQICLKYNIVKVYQVRFDPTLKKVVDATKWGVSNAAQSLAEDKKEVK